MIQKTFTSITLCMLICSIFTVFLPTTIVKSADDGGQYDLSILAPVERNESEAFVVTIQSNNTVMENVSVTFNKITEITNSSGMVVFNPPSILSSDNNTFSITAVKEGYNSAISNITIINLPKLIMWYNEVYYGEDFTVTVTADEVVEGHQTYTNYGNETYSLISNATVLFNNKTYITDANGEVTIIAPQKKPTKFAFDEYNISVTKAGFLDDTGIITVSKNTVLSGSGLCMFGFLFYFLSIIVVIVAILVGVILILKRKKII